MADLKRRIIGIDTGGTYTDAAVIDPVLHQVIARAKALTTRGDLSRGVSEAMAAVLAGFTTGPAAISMVGLSTTLATNAVVEGHGSPVAAVLIGFDEPMVERSEIKKLFPNQPILCIAGGHDHNGEASVPLDEAALHEALPGLSQHVSAFAVASAFAVRNPAHEFKARDIITRLTGKPVSLSRELTSSLDAPRRALTAVLNARLISRISDLIRAVRRSMVDLDISAPLMVVRGDGSLAAAEEVALRPVETVLSGPAASFVGARWLSGRNDFILSDIGGTTTDIGLVRDGKPQLAEEGASVGGRRTMVQAIDIRTIGLGGDSDISCEGGALRVGPQRATPLALLGRSFPQVEAMLRDDLSDQSFSSLHGKFALLPLGHMPLGHEPQAVPPGLSAREEDLLSKIGPVPVPLRHVAASAAALRILQSLTRRGLVQLSGFTPSDAAHVLGLQDNWSAEAARIGAACLLRLRDMRVPSEQAVISFCQSVWHEVVALSAEAVIETTCGETVQGSPFLSAVSRGEGELGLARVAISPVLPVIAVGGPARIVYESVGRKLGCELCFVEHFDVANAIGAAVGSIGLKVHVVVEGDGRGLFRVYGGDKVGEFTSASAALSHAAALAEALAQTAARHRGAVDPEVKVTLSKSFLPDALNDDGLLRADVLAEAEASSLPFR